MTAHSEPCGLVTNAWSPTLAATSRQCTQTLQVTDVLVGYAPWAEDDRGRHPWPD